MGPLETYTLADGTAVPFYVIKFDKRGTCTTPRTRTHLTNALREGLFTDVYLFAHGWNNTPEAAIDAYRRWIAGYQAMRASGGYTVPRPYRPVLVGVVWPSIWIVPWWERGPGIAAGGLDDEREAAIVAELAEGVAEDQRERFYALVETPELSESEAREFIGLLGALYRTGDDDVAEAEGPAVDDLLLAWDALAVAGEPSAFVPEDDDEAAVVRTGGVDDPQAAGSVARAPFDGIRLFSVWQIKDRAAKVGASGVADLLRDLLDASEQRSGRTPARTHLVGHSFGAKILLSAICSPNRPDLARPVTSLLLLQPAINGYALADRVPERNLPGGYHAALGRVAQPILSTFSAADSPLRTFFHVGLRRAGDLGEAQIAADEPPGPYAAMGGYGPRGVDSLLVIDIRSPGQDYPLGVQAPQVYGVRATRRITGHGEINNPYAYWALYCLVRAS